MKKCILCNQRKGKRSCPAKGDLICAQCCGEKRILEINCPEECEYLKVGREHEGREYRRYLLALDPRKHEAHEKVLSENGDVVAHVEFVLARERLTMRNLTDLDAAEALDLLLENYRTEDKGILYERTAGDLQTESLRRALRDVIESHRHRSEDGTRGVVGSQEKRLSLKSAIECLEFVRDLVDSHLSTSGSATSYVDMLARLVPGVQPVSDARRSIIIP